MPDPVLNPQVLTEFFKTVGDIRTALSDGKLSNAEMGQVIDGVAGVIDAIGDNVTDRKTKAGLLGAAQMLTGVGGFVVDPGKGADDLMMGAAGLLENLAVIVRQ
ncbi:hypothetical protein K8I61_00815 [bacterium]|nr:hypothetical protein [bacterium]